MPTATSGVVDVAGAVIVGRNLPPLRIQPPPTILYADPNGEVWSVKPDGTSATKLTVFGTLAVTAPAWSPDFSRIAFVREYFAAQPTELWVMNADGSGQTLLWTGSGSFPAGHYPRGAPSWRPDGDQLVVGYAGSRTAPVVGFAFVNPDGSGLSFIPLTIPASGGNTGYMDTEDAGIHWSPDGSRIAFSVFQSPGPPYNSWAAVAAPDGSGLQVFTAAGGTSDGWPQDWFADSAHLLTYVDYSANNQLVKLALDGTFTVIIDDGGVAPHLQLGAGALSPDESELVFLTWSGGFAVRAVTMPIGGGAASTVVPPASSGSIGGVDW